MPASGRNPRDFLIAAAVGILYFLFARFGLLFSGGPAGVAVFWPASGLQLAALILGGRERRPLFLAVLLATNVLSNLLGHKGLPASIGFGLANVLEGWLAITLIDRFGSGRFRLTNVKDANVFVVPVVLGCSAASALPGAATAAAFFGAPFATAWIDWWLADACGMLLVTPFLVEWASEGGDRLRNPDWRRLLEGAVAIALCALIFRGYVLPAQGTDRIHNAYILVPFLVWIVVRLETLGMVTANLLLAVTTTFHAMGRFGESGTLPADVIVQAQLFAGITAGSMLFLSAVLSERRRMVRELRSLNDSLERKVVERTATAEEKARLLEESGLAQRRLVEDLGASNAELDAFSSSVAHDLRAPLRTLTGFGLALREDCGDRLGDQGIAYLDRMREAVSRMETLIDALMALARVSRSEMRRVGFDLAALGREVAAEMERRDGRRSVAFRSPESIPVTADPRMLRLLLTNLLDNAWKFTARRPDAVVEMGVAGEPGRPEYYVRDNGVGFDMAFAEDMFLPFRRLHPDDEFPGTGIGLATVRRIVARHGGRIRAEGRPGHGAGVYFTLSQGPEEAPTEKEIR